MDDEGVLVVDDNWDEYDGLTARDAIKDLEAILISALRPTGNLKVEKFREAEVWTQVANVRPPEVETLDDLRDRLE